MEDPSMQCKQCGAIIESAASACSKCGATLLRQRDVNAESQSDADETWFTGVEQFFAAHITPQRAKIIFVIAIGAILLSILISWHPWRRPVQPSPYTIPAPGSSRQQPDTNWIPGAR
jgi:uncharacterized membrane protein YvbJ